MVENRLTSSSANFENNCNFKIEMPGQRIVVVVIMLIAKLDNDDDDDGNGEVHRTTVSELLLLFNFSRNPHHLDQWWW